jgi:hypothetical protein
VAGVDQRVANGTLVRVLDRDVGDLDRLPELHHSGREPLALGNRGDTPGCRESRGVALVCIVACPQSKLRVRLVILPDVAAGRASEPIRPHDDGLQHRLEVQRRADRAADLAERRELLHRVHQLGRPRSQLLEQTDVLDGDHCLVGERLEQLDLLRREGTAGGATDGNGADGSSFAEHRHRQHASIADRPCKAGVVLRLTLDINDVADGSIEDRATPGEPPGRRLSVT